ncbi:hypothetical protein FB567DRAFT_546712 [Paraphoma chrysanthemicola]|uniref:Uncharacterized protein n=1 Tax=Paraphoma chrysanthemicola TaxID=798071 RepID=A0A8K0W1Z1_9PLEO|nr:hypothetical protein FB567DRAFT_546712 [Paraphoma chrysanthemicola]
MGAHQPASLVGIVYFSTFDCVRYALNRIPILRDYHGPSQQADTDASASSQHAPSVADSLSTITPRSKDSGSIKTAFRVGRETDQLNNSNIPQGVPPSFHIPPERNDEKESSLPVSQGRTTLGHYTAPGAGFTTRANVAEATRNQTNRGHCCNEAHEHFQLFDVSHSSDSSNPVVPSSSNRSIRKPKYRPDSSISSYSSYTPHYDPYG